MTRTALRFATIVLATLAMCAVALVAQVTPASASTTGGISGTVTADGGALNENVSGAVVVLDHEGDEITTGLFNSTGSYSVSNLAPGSYRLKFMDWTGYYVPVYSGGASSFDDATPVTVVAGQTESGVNAELSLAAKISGTVTGPGGEPLCDDTQGYVQVYASGDQDDEVSYGGFFMNGIYEVRGIPAGSYVLEFRSYSGGYLSEFYNNKSSFGSADVITLSAGQVRTGTDVQLAEGGSIIGQVFALNRGRSTTLVLVTHDENLAARGGRVLRWKDGRLDV